MNLQEEFLNLFFSSLNNMDGNYCVIHSYEELPFYSEGDIDIAISNFSKNDLESLMIQICNKLSWRITQRLWYDVPECFYYVLSSIKDRSVTLKIDLLFDENAVGYTHYSTGFLTENPVMHNNIKHSSATAEFCYKLTKRIVKGFFKEEDTSVLNELFSKSNKSIVLNHLIRQYGSMNAEQIFHIFDSPKGFSGMLPNQKTLYNAQKLRYKYGSLFRLLARIKWQIQRVAHRLRNPCGAIILLPDIYSGRLDEIKSKLSCASIDSFRVIMVANKATSIHRYKYLAASTLLLTTNKNLTEEACIQLGMLSKPACVDISDAHDHLGDTIAIIDDWLCSTLEHRFLERFARNHG